MPRNSLICGALRGGGEEDGLKALASASETQAQMLAAADLAQLQNAQPAHGEHRTRAARAARLQLVERPDVAERQKLRCDLAVHGQRRAACVGAEKCLGACADRLAEGVDAVTADGKAGGQLMPAVAFQQRRERMERAEQIEAPVGAGGGLSLVAVEADEEGRAAVFLGKTRGDDAHNALMPRFIRQDDGAGRVRVRQHGDGVLIDLRLDLLALTVETA